MLNYRLDKSKFHLDELEKEYGRRYDIENNFWFMAKMVLDIIDNYLQYEDVKIEDNGNFEIYLLKEATITERMDYDFYKDSVAIMFGKNSIISDKLYYYIASDRRLNQWGQISDNSDIKSDFFGCIKIYG